MIGWGVAASSRTVMEPLPGSAPGDDDDFVAWIAAHRVTAPPVTAADIVGIGHALREAGSLVARLKATAASPAPRGRRRIPRGVLLYGRPGVGKTLTARYMAASLGADVPFYEFSSDEITAAGIRAILRFLSAAGQSVLYIDEIDCFGLARSDGRHTENTRKTLAAMLTGLDGLIANPNVLIICSSNTHPASLDRALMRPGRIGFVITFQDPEEGDRERLFRFFATDLALDGTIDWGRCARMTRGKTPADIGQMVDDAFGLAALDGRDAVREADLFAAIDRDGVIEPEPVVAPDFWPRTAIHEAGHVAATVVLRGADRVYSVAMDAKGGKTYTDLDKTIVSHRTNVSIFDAVVIAYAGSRAERLIYGDFALGSHSDHQNASGVISSIINAGLAEELSLLAPPAFRDPDLLSEAIKGEVVDIAKAHARRGQARADAIVAANRAGIELIAAELLATHELSGERLIALIAAAGFVDEAGQPVRASSPGE